MNFSFCTTVSDFQFLRPDGANFAFRNFRDKPILLILLRHLA